MPKVDLFGSLPEDLISKVLGLLPLQDRARLEATAKVFFRLSRARVREADFTLTDTRDVEGIISWLDKVSDSSQLQKIVLKSLLYHNEDLQLSKFKNLTELSLWDGQSFRGTSMTRESLTQLQHLPKLRRLALKVQPTEEMYLTPWYLEEFSCLTELQSLSLCTASSEDYGDEIRVAVTSRLTELRLGLEGTADFLEFHALQAPFMSLCHLRCKADPDAIPWGKMAPSLSRLDLTSYEFSFILPDSLQHLTWSNPPMPYEGPNAFPELCRLTNLTSLDLKWSAVSSLENFSGLKLLKQLSLAVCTDKENKPSKFLLSPFLQLTSLETLWLAIREYSNFAIPVYALLEGDQRLSRLKNLTILWSEVPGPRLDARLHGLPELQALELRHISVLSSPMSTALTRLVVDARRQKGLYASGVSGICSSFMGSLSNLKFLWWSVPDVHEEESVLLAESIQNLQNLQELHFERGDIATTAEISLFKFGFQPGFPYLLSLHTLEIIDPNRNWKIHLKRTMIPSVRRLAVLCGDLQLCRSCFGETTVVAVFCPDPTDDKNSENRLVELARACPGTYVDKKAASNDNGEKTITIIKYDRFSESWEPDSVDLSRSLTKFLSPGAC